MIGRCTHESYPSYKRYGGKGIRVCEEWINSFESFEKWALANGYSGSLTLDRKDSKKDYCPDNCRWATMREQQNNRADNHVVTYNGKSQTVSQWASELGIKTQTLFSRFKRHWSVEKALTTKTGGRKA
jgi:hypothetical protein